MLDVGSGSGYSTAVLAALARRGDRGRAGRRSSPSARARPSPSSGSTTSRSSPPTAARACRIALRSSAIAVHATAPGPAARAAPPAHVGGRLVVPVAARPGRHADRLPAHRARRSTRRPATGSRPASSGADALRAADRPRGLRARDRDRGVDPSPGPGRPADHGRRTYALNFYSAVFIDQLKRGRKTATIRLGDKSRKYKRGQIVWVTVGFRHSPREKIFDAVIDDVEVKKVTRALAARHRARQPRVPPARGDDAVPRADLRPRRSPRTTSSP